MDELLAAFLYLMNLAELSNLIGTELRGDGTVEVTGIASLGETAATQVTLVADAAKLSHWLEHIDSFVAAAFILPEKLASHEALTQSNLLVAKDAKLAFARAIRVFYGKPYENRGVSSDLQLGAGSTLGESCSILPRVTIGRDCSIGNRVTLHPGVVLGDRVKVGDDTVIFPNVSVYNDTEIGARCRLHSGVVLGADGFSFTPDEQGRQFKLLQVGRVVLEDDVEIGANCCVDRAGFGETRIRRGAKFDNLIQIGHNCDIGEDTVVAALTGFSGGAKVGRNVIIAGQVGTNQHISIGDRAIVTARTGVTKSVEAGKIVGGLPVQDHMKWRRLQALIAKLPELFERVKNLEKGK
ncbi:MAG: UDP-3-O-(3-hydroxymyristoyl)glucosamine N-acyltransferase [Acidobacteria bacterium]|nr:UDP-3-O-(3-hydroxymyristoyl)glucosamine N-acyltransferase [Acidobacteriota bacterium]